MAKKIELRIANKVDTTKVFSANLRGGGRGIDDETMALESHSNDVCPTIRTITNFVLICEPMKEETNKEPKICAMRGRGDNNNQQIEFGSSEYSNALTTVSKDCLVVEPSIIANTAGFGQCYESKEVSPTVKSSAFQYNNALIEPIEQEVLETQHNLPFRVRRLTERELFRLMDVSEEDIDKIQAAGISKTQQAKMTGNSIVVNVLYEIFRKMFVETHEEQEQMTLF